MAVLQTSRLHGEKIATCGIFLRKKKDNFLTKIFKNFYNLCINVERRINKHFIYYHCTAVTEKMQVFRTDFLFLTIMSHKKNAQVSRRRFSVGIGIHKLIFFRQAFALSGKKK